MDFANERYVRMYTRETTTWRLLGWEGQALLPQILRLVDRSGVLELGRRKPETAIAAHLPGWPRPMIAAGVAALIAEEVLEHRGNVLVWPRFLEAQETPQSDAQRKREWRSRRRDQARTGQSVPDCGPTGTNRSQNGTSGNVGSLLSDPCCAVPDLTEPDLKTPGEQAAGTAEETEPDPPKKKRTRARRDNGAGGFTDWAADAWAAQYSQSPTWAKKDWAALSTTWKKLGDEEARRRWANYLATVDPFFAGHPPAKFGSEPDRFVTVAVKLTPAELREQAQKEKFQERMAEAQKFDEDQARERLAHGQ